MNGAAVRTAAGLGPLGADVLYDLIGRMRDGVVVVDRRGMVLLTNRAAEQMLRPMGAALAGTEFGYSAAIADRAEIDIAETGVVAQLRVQPVNLEGRPAHLITLRDVTDRRRAADRLELVEALLEQAERALGVGSFELDVHSGQATSTAGMSRITGRSSDELLSTLRMAGELVVHPDDRERWRRATLASEAGEQPFDMEFRVVRPDGEIRVVRSFAEPVLGADGRPVKIRGVVRDITDERRTTKALQDSEERFRLLAEHSQDAIFRVRMTPPATVEYFSPAAESVLGYAPQELTGDLEQVAGLLHPMGHEAAESVLRSPDGRPRVFRYTRPDGSTVWVEQWAIGIRDEDENLIAVEGSMRDVTARVVAEQEKLSLVHQLEQTERLESLGRLAGGISHDFNNLLAVILGTAQLLAEELRPDDPRLADVQRIVHTAERGAALTRQLLIFSRREPSQPETVDLDQIVSQVRDIVQRTIGEDICFSYRPSPALPPINVDRARIEQVIINLVVNARAAMPEGGSLTIETTDVTIPPEQGPPELTASRVPPGQYVVLIVADTGTGMPPEVARHVFEPFFTTRGPGKGTGLGLATVHGIVTEAGGHITLHSRPGHGTTFRIYLPASPGQAPGAAADTAGTAPAGHGETILLVEDEEPVREVVRRILTRNNYRVLTAHDPQHAISLCAQSGVTVDALLTDMVMPGMSGSQLAEHLQTIRPGLPVLLMSGYADHAGHADDGGHAEDAGHAGHGDRHAGTVQPEVAAAPILRKPFDVDTLLHLVHRALNR